MSSRTWRSSPRPSKAAPNSSTTVRRLSRSTELARSSTLVRTSVGGAGVLVSASSMTEPLPRKGPSSRVGRRSTYCSPTAERFATTAVRLSGIGGASFSIRSSASTPSSVSSMGPTRPTETPR
ncbi:hypothetical protein M2436_006510 [Streptomyces sp. HB372]|nr:hypothetical protein [Streptomyces sp. HB372]